MAETTPMARISIHYWAGARAAASVEVEVFEADSVAAALEQARQSHQDPRFDRVLEVSSVLIDGLQAHDHDLKRLRADDTRVEILPPFAGGART